MNAETQTQFQMDGEYIGFIFYHFRSILIKVAHQKCICHSELCVVSPIFFFCLFFTPFMTNDDGDDDGDKMANTSQNRYVWFI